MTDLLNGTPTLDDRPPVIVDDRILTSCAAVCARMDGWWTFAVGITLELRLQREKEPSMETPLTRNTVLMDRDLIRPRQQRRRDREAGRF
jgi:hypothetical protein